MPCIDCKVTVELTEEKKEQLKSQFGKAIGILGKPETYLMVTLSDKADIYLGGNKLDQGASLTVSALGEISSFDSNKMTNTLCDIIKEVTGIPPRGVYISYWSTKNWGWNGQNF
ncbi:MAG: hypothetical protein K5659_08860 [Lachnospiraceae bacterium]|jgi:phenylpyruvate tautomerase PptA (4-oxalocrotonate tautomerase family)|nr:hypothetical protein [Lachnospiraceae bacterium]